MKLVSRILVLLVLSPFLLASCSSDDNKIPDELVIDYKDLPAESKGFITEHFPDQEVILVKKNPILEWDNKGYEVDLSNNIELDFDDVGQWLKVDTNRFMPVPTAIIPSPITNYVTEHYVTSFIEEIEKKFYGYSIDLNNGLDMRFDFEGKFLGLDK